MKIFRSMSFVLGMAIAGLCSFTAQASENLGIHLTRYVESDYVASATKFTAELAQNRQARTMYASVNSDLMREGHGFRQASAAEELVLSAPIS